MIDLDSKLLENYNFSNAYVTIDNFLKSKGINKYFRGLNFSTCKSQVEITLIIQDLYGRYPNLKRCVRSIRLIVATEIVDLSIIDEPQLSMGIGEY